VNLRLVGCLRAELSARQGNEPQGLPSDSSIVFRIHCPSPQPARGGFVESEVVAWMEGLTWTRRTYVRMQMTRVNNKSVVIHRPKPRPTRGFRSSADNNLAVMSLWLWAFNDVGGEQSRVKFHASQPSEFFRSQTPTEPRGFLCSRCGGMMRFASPTGRGQWHQSQTMPGSGIQGNAQRPRAGRGPGQGPPQLAVSHECNLSSGGYASICAVT